MFVGRLSSMPPIVLVAGMNSNGELGDGSMAGSSIAPVKVTGGHSFISLGQAGRQQTCAIATRRQGDAGQTWACKLLDPLQLYHQPLAQDCRRCGMHCDSAVKHSGSLPHRCMPHSAHLAEASSPTAGAPPSPAAPGLPLPAPAEASQTASTPSSSVPVGAIVGGVAAGVGERCFACALRHAQALFAAAT